MLNTAAGAELADAMQPDDRFLAVGQHHDKHNRIRHGASHGNISNHSFSSALDIIHLDLETFSPQSASRLNLNEIDQTKISIDGNEKEYETDTGYAWIILVACSLIMPVAVIPMTTSGMFYVEFLTSFPEQAHLTLWACSLNAALVYLIGPVAAVLVEKSSARVCAIIGCAGMALSLTVAGLTTSFPVFFTMYGLLAASFGSCMYIPSCTFAAHHFKKYRHLALIIPTVTGATPFLTIPPLIALLLEKFGWREATLVIAAMSMQVTVLAAMMRPPRTLKCISNGSDSKLGKESMESESSYSSEVDEKFYLDHDPVDPNTGFAARFRPLIHWRMILLLSKSFMRGWSSGVYYVLVPYFVQQYGLNATDVTHLYMVGGVTNIGIRILLIIAGRIKDYNKSVIAFFGLISISSSLFGYTVYPSSTGFFISSAMFGLGHGIIASLANPVILEMHGMYRIELVFGLEMMCVGIASLASPPFVDMVRQYLVADDIIGFRISAAICLCGALTFIPHFILLYCVKRISNSSL